MYKKIIVIGVSIGIVIVLRSLFDKSTYLTYIVAGINIVAGVFVICTILEKIQDCIEKRINESSIPEQILKRELGLIRRRIWGMSSVIGVILIILYLIFACSELGNDIISIVTLGISVLDDEIVKIVTST